MAKHAVRVAVRNVVKVVAAPPHVTGTGGRKAAAVGAATALPAHPQPELLSGVSWDAGRRVWLVRPASAPARG